MAQGHWTTTSYVADRRGDLIHHHYLNDVYLRFLSRIDDIEPRLHAHTVCLRDRIWKPDVARRAGR